MALETETGTGSATAESYISVADCDTYLAARNQTLWASADFSTAEKEGCLRRATDYMQQVYRMRWRGTRVNTTQALDWPRYNVPRPDHGTYTVSLYASDAVPTEVQHACAELAWRAAFGELAPDLSRKTASEKVGEIAVQYEAGAAQYVRFVAVDRLLAPLLKTAGGALPLVRA
jgi:hypothetical protein